MQINTTPKFSKIARIYAENGLVHMESTDKPGLNPGKARIVSLTPAQAAQRATALNNSIPHITDPEERRQTEQLVELTIDACRKAQHQQESPDSRKTELVSKALTPAGRITEGEMDEDELVQQSMIVLHTLKEDEIRAVLRMNHLDEDSKARILAGMHGQRVLDSNKKAVDDQTKGS